MTLPVRQKKASESLELPFDFGTKIQAGDALTGSPTVTATAGLSFTSARSGNIVTVLVSGGTDGSDYNLKVACSTTNGALPAMSATIEVREAAN